MLKRIKIVKNWQIFECEVKMRADLHMHTTYSDGALLVSELLDLNIVRGNNIVAITDHDCLDGYKEAVTLNKDIQLVCGLELTTRYNDESIHILGYFKNIKDAFPMEDFLEERIKRRKERAYLILQKLQETYNIKLNPEFIEKTKSVTRATILQEILQAKYPYTRKQIFSEMIGEGCPAYVPSSKIHTRDGIKMIQNCGGIAVIAHPMEIKKSDVEEIIAFGVDGIEAVYAAHLEQEIKYRELAKKHNLLITAGTDFHRFQDGKHGEIGDAYLTGLDLEKFLKALYER